MCANERGWHTPADSCMPNPAGVAGAACAWPHTSKLAPPHSPAHLQNGHWLGLGQTAQLPHSLVEARRQGTFPEQPTVRRMTEVGKDGRILTESRPIQSKHIMRQLCCRSCDGLLASGTTASTKLEAHAAPTGHSMPCSSQPLLCTSDVLTCESSGQAAGLRKCPALLRRPAIRWASRSTCGL